jgi:type I restriction enzyme R subunit
VSGTVQLFSGNLVECSVRFPGWQSTNKGEREVKMALRKTLAKYQLHRENDVFERAYGYIAEYY